MNAIDIVLPVAAKDSLRLRTVGASLRKFWRVPGKLWIFAPDQDCMEVVAAAREHLRDRTFEVEVVADSVLLKRQPSWNARKEVGNWWQQQLIKLCAAEVVGTDFYLILDADCFCARPIEYGDLVVDGRGVVAMEAIDMFHPTWYRASMDVLGLPSEMPKEFVNVTPFLMARTPARALLARLEELHGPNWKGALLLKAQQAQRDSRACLTWTEYTLYYLHACATGLWSKWHREQKELLTGNSVWFIDQVAGWDARKSFEQDPTAPPFYFSLVQSHVSVPIEWVWERVRPFLSA